MKVKFFKEKNYNLHYLSVDSFRHSSFSIVFTSSFEPKKAVAFAFLTDILTEASTNYPSRKYIEKFLDNNYMYNFYGSYIKVGKSIQTYVSCDYIDEKYVDCENYLENIYKFIFDIISNPLTENGGFSKSIFESVKNRHIKGLKSLDGNNKFIANDRALKLYSSNPEISFHMKDMFEYIQNLTPQELYKEYLELIKETSIDIIISGNDDPNVIAKLVKKYFPFYDTKPYKKYEEVTLTEHRLLPKKKVDKSFYNQSCIYLIYNIDNPTMYEREFVSKYYLDIISYVGLNSKLDQSLREKNQLCYSVGASVWDRNSILVISSTVKVGKEKQAIKLMKQAVKDMTNNISKEEFTGAYYSEQRGLKGVTDSMGAMGRIYTNQYFSGFSSYEEILKKIKEVKVSEIYSYAKKIKLNTVYVLKGDNNERTED